MNPQLTPADLEYVPATEIVLGDILVNWNRPRGVDMDVPPTQVQLSRKTTRHTTVFRIVNVPTTSGTAFCDYNIWINNGDVVFAGPLNANAEPWQVPAGEWRVRKA